MSARLDGAQPYPFGQFRVVMFRVVIGFLFACHGAATLFGVLVGPAGGGSGPAGTWPTWYAAAINLVGGVLVALGLGTRIAALVRSGSMGLRVLQGPPSPTRSSPRRTVGRPRRSSAGRSCCWFSRVPAP